MRAIKMYAQSHDGEIPSNWSDLDAFLRSKEHPSSWGSDGRSFFFGEMERLLGEKVEEKFLLVADSGIAMAGRDGSSRFDSGTVIVVSASPIGEDRRDEAGRYVIWQKKSGEILSAWIGESLIQNQFREAGATLKTGPIAVQPPTIDKEFDRLVKEYAEANFTNPENPTKKELQDLEDYVADKYKEENSDYDSAESAATESSQSNTVPSKGKSPQPPSLHDQAEKNDDDDGRLNRIAIIALAGAVLVLVIFGIKKLGSAKGSPRG